jgi:hypothetical protein
MIIEDAGDRRSKTPLTLLKGLADGLMPFYICGIHIGA